MRVRPGAKVTPRAGRQADTGGVRDTSSIRTN